MDLSALVADASGESIKMTPPEMCAQIADCLGTEELMWASMKK